MRKVRYDGPGARLRAYGHELDRGESDKFSDEEAEALAANPNIHVTVSPVGAKTAKTTADDAAPPAAAGAGQHDIHNNPKE